MYCKRCLSLLPEQPEDIAVKAGDWLGGKPGEIPYASPRKRITRCKRCFRKFDPDDRRTYLETLAIRPWELFVKIVLTTAFGVLAAYIVAFHQLVITDGH
jgi:hypothetical protein